MNVLYVDPGLSRCAGHNAAMLEELDDALAAEGAHRVTVLASAVARPDDFAHLRGTLRPTFRVDGYARPTLHELADPAKLEWIDDTLSADLDAVALETVDTVLMPTAYPFHLRALARHAARLRGARIVLGLLLPARFWSAEREARVADVFAHALHTLGESCDLMLYNETGRFDLGEHGTLSIPTMLPPLARRNAALVERLAHAGIDAARLDRSRLDAARAGATTTGTSPAPAPAIGFFGSPFTSKGFELLAVALRAMVEAGTTPPMRVVVRLPEGYESTCATLSSLAPWIDARSARTRNEDYLAEMAAVDAVWAFYDPVEYRDKMSGIVPEAISLGKPLLVADGCDAIADFIERQAPCSHVCGPYDARTVVDALSLPPASWARQAACARGHAPMMREMKRMDRFLAVCGIA